jgi:hypothetical protein
VSGDPGIEGAYTSFETRSVVDLVRVVNEIGNLGIDHGQKAIYVRAQQIIGKLVDGLNKLSLEIADYSRDAIVSKMLESHTASRPLTGDMETHVVSMALPLGGVRVALLAELDRVVNPEGYEAFWPAQEWGTDSDMVKSQVGRGHVGTFEPSGTPPDVSQRGLNKGTDRAWVSGGDNPGFGRITVELPGRHFLRDGAADARVLWRERITALQADTLAQLRELQAIAKPRTNYVFKGHIQA